MPLTHTKQLLTSNSSNYQKAGVFLACHMVFPFTNSMSVFGRQPSLFLHSHLIFISLFSGHNLLLSTKGKILNHICWMEIVLMLVHSNSQNHLFRVSKYNWRFLKHSADHVLFCLLNEGCQIAHRDSDGLDQSVTWHTMCPSWRGRGRLEGERPAAL